MTAGEGAKIAGKDCTRTMKVQDGNSMGRPNFSGDGGKATWQPRPGSSLALSVQIYSLSIVP